jgi:hypothetical protein
MPNIRKVPRKNNRRGPHPKSGAAVKFQPMPHPPDFMSRPWYALVVRINNVGTSLTSQGLATALNEQLSITVTGGFLNIRLLSIRAWGAIVPMNSTSALSPLVMVVNDLFNAVTSGTTRILEQITSYPDQVSRACVGYKYDRAHQDLSIFMTTSGADITNIAQFSGMGAHSVVYVHLLWRCSINAPTFEEEWDDVQSTSVKCACRH